MHRPFEPSVALVSSMRGKRAETVETEVTVRGGRAITPVAMVDHRMTHKEMEALPASLSLYNNSLHLEINRHKFRTYYRLRGVDQRSLP